MSLSIYNAIKYRQEITPNMINVIKEKLSEEKVKDADLIKIMELIKVRNGHVLVNEKDAIFSEDLFLVLNMLNSGFEEIDVTMNTFDAIDEEITKIMNELNSTNIVTLDFSKYKKEEQVYLYKRLLLFYQDKIYNLIEVLKNKDYYFDIDLLKQIKDEYKETYAIYIFIRNKLDALNLEEKDAVLINLEQRNNKKRN